MVTISELLLFQLWLSGIFTSLLTLFLGKAFLFPSYHINCLKAIHSIHRDINPSNHDVAFNPDHWHLLRRASWIWGIVVPIMDLIIMFLMERPPR